MQFNFVRAVNFRIIGSGQHDRSMRHQHIRLSARDYPLIPNILARGNGVEEKNIDVLSIVTVTKERPCPYGCAEVNGSWPDRPVA